MKSEVMEGLTENDYKYISYGVETNKIIIFFTEQALVIMFS